MTLTVRTVLDTEGWVSIAASATSAIIEVNSPASLFIGSTAPAASVVGFTLPLNVPVAPPSIAALGGGLWLKSEGGTVTAKYDVA